MNGANPTLVRAAAQAGRWRFLLVGLVLSVLLVPLRLLFPVMILVVLADVMVVLARMRRVEPVVDQLVRAIGEDETRRAVDQARRRHFVEPSERALGREVARMLETARTRVDCSEGHSLGCPHRPVGAELPAEVTAHLSRPWPVRAERLERRHLDP